MGDTTEGRQVGRAIVRLCLATLIATAGFAGNMTAAMVLADPPAALSTTAAP